MRHIVIKTVILAVNTAMIIPQVWANDLIDNRAYGVVQGNITQEAMNGAENTIDVGSIIYEPHENLSNVSVSSIVKGDMFLRTTGQTTTHVRIGSYTGQ